MATIIIYSLLCLVFYIVYRWVKEGANYVPPDKPKPIVETKYVFVSDSDPTPPYGIKIPD